MTPEHRQQFEEALQTHYEIKTYVEKGMAKYDQIVSEGKTPRFKKSLYGSKGSTRIFIIEFCPVKGRYLSSTGWQGTSNEKICGCGCAAYSHNPKNTLLV